MSRMLQCVWVVMLAGLIGVGSARPLAAQGTGSLSGVVTDESGGAVGSAAVALIDPRTDDVVARTTSGADGGFTFAGIAAGNYRLEFSRPRFETTRLDVTVDATPSTPRAVLRVAGVSENVDVNASARNGYVTQAATAGTRTPTPIESIPQSIVTVPRAMIDDQGARTLSEALRNVSNVALQDERDANNAVLKIRGFHSATVVDGVAMPGYFPNQERLSNVERIDVLKGPAGALFGTAQSTGSYGTLGGTIAITTAPPSQTPVRRIALSAGSFGQRGASLDVNQPLGSTLAARIAVDVSDADSESDGVFFRKRAFYPSLMWTPAPKTQVTLRTRYLDSATLDYSGLPVRGTLTTSSFTLPRRTNPVAADLPDTTYEARGLNLQASHALSSTWTLSLLAAYNQAVVDQRGSWLVDATSPFGCFDFGTVNASFNVMCGARLWDRFKTTTVSPAVTGVFSRGAATHTVSAGVDHERATDHAFLAYSNLFGPVSFQPVSLLNPVYPAWAEPLEPATPDQQNRYVTTVAYVQEQFDRGPVHLLGSLRVSNIDVTDANPVFGVDNISTNRAATPRVGGVYDLTTHASVFAGYSEGIKVPIGSIFATPPKPEESRQTEVGVRLKRLAGLTASAAWFDLTRLNVAIADPVNLGFSMQAGRQRSRGVDADLRWQLSDGLTLVGAVTAQTSEILEASTPGLVGTQLFNVPERTARLAGRYDVPGGRLAGLGVGLGVTYQSELPGNSFNTFFTPAATVWDSQVSYSVKKVRLGLNVGNLADRKYYIPSNYFGGNQVIPALPRTFAVTARIGG